MGSPAEQSVLLSLLGGGFVAAFLHAALPTHWLPFVLVGRAQRWSMARTLLAVVVAGLAHIVTTAVLGGLIVAAGLALDQWIKGVLPHLSAVLLFLFGAFYLTRATLKRPVPASGPPLSTIVESFERRCAPANRNPLDRSLSAMTRPPKASRCWLMEARKVRSSFVASLPSISR